MNLRFNLSALIAANNKWIMAGTLSHSLYSREPGPVDTTEGQSIEPLKHESPADVHSFPGTYLGLLLLGPPKEKRKCTYLGTDLHPYSQ